MKWNNLLRFVSILAFLLLLAPFYDHCNGQRMKAHEEKPAEQVGPVVEVDSISEVDSLAPTVDTLYVAEQKNEAPNQFLVFADECYDFIDDGDSESGFEMMQWAILVLYDDFNDWDKTMKLEDFMKQRFCDQVGFVGAYIQFPVHYAIDSLILDLFYYETKQNSVQHCKME